MKVERAILATQRDLDAWLRASGFLPVAPGYEQPDPVSWVRNVSLWPWPDLDTGVAVGLHLNHVTAQVTARMALVDYRYGPLAPKGKAQSEAHTYPLTGLATSVNEYAVRNCAWAREPKRCRKCAAPMVLLTKPSVFGETSPERVRACGADCDGKISWRGERPSSIRVERPRTGWAKAVWPVLRDGEPLFASVEVLRSWWKAVQAESGMDAKAFREFVEKFAPVDADPLDKLLTANRASDSRWVRAQQVQQLMDAAFELD